MNHSDSGFPAYARRYPIGAEVKHDGVHFRVWAPERQKVDVVLSNQSVFPLKKEVSGYFSGMIEGLSEGGLYRFRLDEDVICADPVSRFQPEGVHGWSQVIDPQKFQWTDHDWPGIILKGQILYELHIGTFTASGTWLAAVEELSRLAELGITILQVMPVAEFPGKFGWGYDGTYWFAPARVYGSPDDFRVFIDRAHSLGMGVMLDVVYNHWGPDGNYHAQYSPFYMSTAKTSWGDAINFDGPHADSVRELVITNACYWIEEFHIDGLRLDATHEIFDSSEIHIVKELTQKSREAAGKKSVLIVAENDRNDSRLILPENQGGFGIDAVWNDDFHHSAHVALTGQRDAYYSDFKGTPQELISLSKYGYLYQGQYRGRRKMRSGYPRLKLSPATSIVFLENHDQVANSLTGDRLRTLTTLDQYRAMMAFLLFSPGTPMLFQGQELGVESPFCFFADHHEELAPLVYRGRREFLSQFGQTEESIEIASPCDLATVQAAVIQHSHSDLQIQRLVHDLIRIRKKTPAFQVKHPCDIDGAVLSDKAFLLRYFHEDAGDRLLLINLGEEVLASSAEPLLAPCIDRIWEPMWNSADPAYGGAGIQPIESSSGWRLPAACAVLLQPA